MGKKALIGNEKRKKIMLTICGEIFDKLLKREVNYCHWKSNEHLEEGLDGKTDLDILVSEKHAKKFRDTLTECKCIRVKPQLGSRYPKVEEWIGFDKETGKLIHLHVHFRIITGTKHLKEYMLPWHDLALQTKVLDDTGKVYIMEPDLELIILYIRIVLKQSRKIEEMERFELSREYRREISWLKQRIDPKRVAQLADKVWGNDKEEFIQIILREKNVKKDFVKLQKLARDKINSVRRGRILNNLQIQAVCRQVITCKLFLKEKWGIVPFTTLKTVYGKGCVIAFIGCDGSGKSSVTREICNWLGWKLDSQNFYFGMGDRYKKPFVYKLSQNNLFPEPLRKTCSLLFYYGISLRCKYMRRLIELYVKRGGIAICDRYPQTQFKGIYDGPKIQALRLYDETVLGKFFIKMEEKNLAEAVSEKADCVFKLILSAELAVQRSPGHNIGEVKRKADITEKLQFPNCDVYKIDVRQPYEKELLQIKEIIWEKLVERQL